MGGCCGRSAAEEPDGHYGAGKCVENFLVFSDEILYAHAPQEVGARSRSSRARVRGARTTTLSPLCAMRLKRSSLDRAYSL